jgi:hypothetical protein
MDEHRIQQQDDHVSTRHHMCPRVHTNRSAGPAERNERGVDIIDDGGGLVYIRDTDLPIVIALLARHLSGEEINLLEQEPVSSLWDSDDIDEALGLVEAQLAGLQDRKQAIIAYQAELDARVAAMPLVAVSYVSLQQLLFEEQG